ncbi:MAG: VWA domain-containing protein [Croceitalea sp.]|nr:VWA domain-containing protein [Croceitalea sp.]
MLILLAAIISLGLMLFQYYFKAKRTKLNALLGVIRFLTIFAGILLLINPKFSKKEFILEKPNLVLLVDNSKSVPILLGGDEAQSASGQLVQNNRLSNSFKLNSYTFGQRLEVNDSIDFNAETSNIANALQTVNEIYGTTKTAVALITDGNQTLGTDYEFKSLSDNITVFPIVVGDTTAYEDINLGEINLNKYAFLKNKFPIEVNLSYYGDQNISTLLKISSKGRVLFRKTVALGKSSNNATINTLLEATNVGINTLKVELSPLKNEKNTSNNSKLVAIEVIDEKTNVTLVSSINHPDLGMLKKSIEANEQRKVTLTSPSINNELLDATDIFILYQPNSSFASLYEILEKRGSNRFTITGTQTDWEFLNNIQSSFSKEVFDQTEEILPQLNKGFDLFDLGGFGMENYPPLDSHLGDVLVTLPHEVLITQEIKGVSLDDPLMFLINKKGAQEVVILGENSWKWRLQAYRNEQSFESFDSFMGKILLFLSEDQQKERLTLTYSTVYQNSSEANIRASYFDELYNFDTNATLFCTIRKADNGFVREIPMLLQNNYYEVDLSDLPAGNYSFTVMSKKDKRSKSGSFLILDYDLEKQFLSANYQKLERLAARTGGQVFYPDNASGMVDFLMKDNRFTPVEKSKENVVSLIDFRILLAFMALSLAAEWFIRKYNGLL